MSIGNDKSYGNKGNNFPWQLKMLQGLQKIADSLSGTSSGKPKVPALERITSTWTNTTLLYAFSVANVGSVNATVLGATLKPGETVNYDASALNNYFNPGTVVIDATGAEVLLSYIN